MGSSAEEYYEMTDEQVESLRQDFLDRQKARYAKTMQKDKALESLKTVIDNLSSGERYINREGVVDILKYILILMEEENGVL